MQSTPRVMMTSLLAGVLVAAFSLTGLTGKAQASYSATVSPVASLDMILKFPQASVTSPTLVQEEAGTQLIAKQGGKKKATKKKRGNKGKHKGQTQGKRKGHEKANKKKKGGKKKR